jgi:hypothetical protein
MFAARAQSWPQEEAKRGEDVFLFVFQWKEIVMLDK